MIASISFTVYEQPLSFSDRDFLFLFMVKYYPLVMGALFCLAVYFKDEKGLLPFFAVALPTFLILFLTYDTFRTSSIDWDSYSTVEEERFVYDSAFGSSDNLDELLPKIKSVNFSGEAGLTPLLASYKERNFETFNYLLENGADVNLMPNGSLQYNIANYIIGDYEQDETSLEYFKAITLFGLDVTIGTRLSNLLQTAVRSKKLWYLKYLLDNGADANRKGNIFLTPIGTATLHGYWDSATYLIPYSSQESLEEAAAIFYDHSQEGRYWSEDASRKNFEQSLLEEGINFRNAFEKEQERN